MSLVVLNRCLQKKIKKNLFYIKINIKILNMNQIIKITIHVASWKSKSLKTFSNQQHL
jgi:hypothetical protein